MAWGDKGTLFAGSWFGTGGNVYAVADEGKTVKIVIKGLTVPTGVAFRDGALYVADVNKIYKYGNAEAALDNMPKPEVVYDDMPPYIPHGWKYLTFDKNGWLYVAFGPPCNICLPPTSTSQIRRIDPATGLAEIVALGVRNSVGGDVDPRSGDYWFTETRAIGSETTLRAISSTRSRVSARTSAIRTATRATYRIRNSTWGRRSEFAPPVLSSARTWRRSV